MKWIINWRIQNHEQKQILLFISSLSPGSAIVIESNRDSYNQVPGDKIMPQTLVFWLQTFWYFLWARFLRLLAYSILRECQQYSGKITLNKSLKNSSRIFLNHVRSNYIFSLPISLFQSSWNWRLTDTGFSWKKHFAPFNSWVPIFLLLWVSGEEAIKILSFFEKEGIPI